MKFFLLSILVAVYSPILAQKKPETVFFGPGNIYIYKHRGRNTVPSNVILKNGDTLSGYTQGLFSQKAEIEFFKNLEDKKPLILNPKNLEKVVLPTSTTKVVFQFKIIADRGARIMELISESEQGYSLYASPFIYSNAHMGFHDQNIAVSIYSVGKKNSALTTEVLNNLRPKNKRFRENIKKVFGDCDGLIQKIENSEFDKSNLREIVAFYNDQCI